MATELRDNDRLVQIAEGTNYIRLNSKFTKQEYAYFDTPNYYADNLLRERNIKIEFISEFGKENTPYIVIFCKIHKKDSEAFESAMEALKRKMIICGCDDYPAFCKSCIEELNLNS